jgi:hypothetical protein
LLWSKTLLWLHTNCKIWFILMKISHNSISIHKNFINLSYSYNPIPFTICFDLKNSLQPNTTHKSLALIFGRTRRKEILKFAWVLGICMSPWDQFFHLWPQSRIPVLQLSSFILLFLTVHIDKGHKSSVKNIHIYHHSLRSASTLTKRIIIFFQKIKKLKNIYIYLKLLLFHEVLLYYHMRSEIIQIVACANYDGFQIPHLHIFHKKNHFAILRIILWCNGP